MSWKNVVYGKNRVRRNYSRVQTTAELPNLIEVQTKSFDWFATEGIKELFSEISPIKDHGEKLELYFGDFEFDEPKYSITEAKRNVANYSRPLKVDVKLKSTETGEIKEQKIFLGEFPMMTPWGTFVINGAERVIVTQIIRSAGAFYSKIVDKKTGQVQFYGQIIPTRGAWIEFEMGSKDIWYAKLDRSKKIPLTTFLRAMGLNSNKDITELFGSSRYMMNTFEKDETFGSDDALEQLYDKLRPGEKANPEGARNYLASRLFDTRRYDLASVGRYKVNKKLDVLGRILNIGIGNCKLTSDVLAKPIVDEVTGEIIDEGFEYKAGTVITQTVFDDLSRRHDAFRVVKKYDENQIMIDGTNEVHLEILDIEYEKDRNNQYVRLVGNDQSEEANHVTLSDILAGVGYFINLHEGIGKIDDIDHLGNRRLRLIGELLQNQFRIGLTKMEKNVKDRMSTSSDTRAIIPQNLINIRTLTSSIREFFGSSQLSQFMDQINPLSELTHKRRLSALGAGGLTRERAGFEVRDVHVSHYGRICPIETPEGQNIGLINNLSCYAKINKYGFIETPYRKVKNCIVTEETEYLSADDERYHTIAQANIAIGENHEILDDKVIARYNGENILANKEDVDYIDVSPKQIVSIASACIPFLENDDTTRALMGANMQRQALPLLRPHAPFVGTGLESKIAHDSGAAVTATDAGTVTYVDSRRIEVANDDGTTKTYHLKKFARANQGTCSNQVAIVKPGQHIEKNQVLADGPAMDNGDLALGQNVTIAFMTWHGYNYEDAVIMSERLVKDDVYTTLHIEEYTIDRRTTKLGSEYFTAEVPSAQEEHKRFLDKRGIVVPGAEVKEGDILVGKTTPKAISEPTPEEKLLHSIFSDKAREGRDASLRVPHGGSGIVLDVKVFSRKNGDELPPNVLETVKVYVIQKRKISEGDKMSGRHGNKGVISRILPVEDMPFLPDGTPVDIMLNPLGVPSRMNIGQILEVHLGMACKKLGGLKIATPVFDGISNEEIYELMERAKMDHDGKTILYDGRTGERFDSRINVGVMYMIKLVHMVDDKLHARSIGPYSLVTQQPLGGKAQNGGQRFGEMEVWALEAYGAAHTLQEMLTIKSDDMVGRNKCYEAILKDKSIPKPGMPESFRVLVKELQALAIDVTLLDKYNNKIDLNTISAENEREERRLHHSIREYAGDDVVQKQEEESEEATAMEILGYDENDSYSDNDGE